MGNRTCTAHIVSGTHWDREWYYSEEVIRTRLIYLFDQVLALIENPKSGFKHFKLDGQSIVADDYLQIKPQNRGRLERAVRAGKLDVGPAYVLPDLCIPTGESIVRNFLVGMRIAKQFGRSMKACYMPDMFGHPSQMPQLARGFGLDSYIFWRGASSPKVTPQTELEWEAPDGTRVFTIHLDDISGYGSAARMPAGRDALKAKMDPVIAEAKRWAASRALILPNCVDHDYAQPEIAEIIDLLHELYPDVEFKHSTLETYVTDARRTLKGKPPVIRGEMRHVSFKPVPNGGELLWGTITSRMYIKQLDRRCDQALLRWAEPLQAIGWLLGARHEPELLERAWKWLLQNHAHDTICGCSPDFVHRASEDRYARCLDIADTLAGYAMDAVLERHPGRTPRRGEWSFAVFNPLPHPVSGACNAVVPLPLKGKLPARLGVINLDGEPVPCVIDAIRKESRSKNRLTEIIGGGWVRNAHLRIWCDELPPFGYRLYRLVPQANSTPNATPTTPDNVLENDHLRAVVNPNGTVDLTHKASGRTFTSLNEYIDKGDSGDEYSYSWPEHDEIIRSTELPCTIRKIEDSPVRIAYEITTALRLPASATKDFRGRARKRVPNPVRTVVSLGRTARRLEFATTVDNRSKDHTLRAAFPTGLRTASSFAEMPFDVTERLIVIEHPSQEAWLEEPATTHPQGTFCYLTDGAVSFAVLNRGMPGYDAPDEPDRRIELTLFRSVGCIARGELLTRRMFLMPVPTPDAYCLGPNTYEYAVAIVENEDRGAIASEAHAFNAGLRSMDSDKVFPQAPAEVSFVCLSPSALVCTAIKRSEDGKLLVVRAYNATNKPLKGRLDLHWPVRKAWHLAPSEAKISEIRSVRGNAVRFNAGRKQIVTLGVLIDNRAASRRRNASWA
ncbi:MAG: hypothetical protein JW889_09670 [Verrucomicrobia bacterium]|nr:hypothetical protein [Verrucomicrobiota bacterium]